MLPLLGLPALAAPPDPCDEPSDSPWLSVGCVLAHPDAVHGDRPPPDALFAGDVRPVDHERVWATAGDVRVEVRYERAGRMSLGERMVVTVNGADPVLLAVPGGYASGAPVLAVSATRLAMADPSVEGGAAVAVFDHRTGARVGTAHADGDVIHLAYEGGWLAVDTFRGWEIWDADGKSRRWSATTPVQVFSGVSADGDALLLAGRVLHRRGGGEPLELGPQCRLIGSDLVYVDAQRRLQHVPLASAGTLVSAPAENRERARVSASGRSAWVDGEVVPAGTGLDRVSVDPDAPRWPDPATQAVTVTVQAAWPVAEWREAPWRVDLDDYTAIDGVVARVLDEDLRYARVAVASPAQPLRVELPAAESRQFTAGTDAVRVGPLPGRANRALDPLGTRAASLVKLGSSKARTIRVVHPDGSPAPGARLYSRARVGTAGADGSFVDTTLASSPPTAWTALADDGWSLPTTDDRIVLSEPPQRCRVVDALGAELVAAAPCDAIDASAVGEGELVPARLVRTAPDLVTVQMRASVWLPGELRLDQLQSSEIVDAKGTAHPTPLYVVSDLAPGPATWRIRYGGRDYCQPLVVSAVVTHATWRFGPCPPR